VLRQLQAQQLPGVHPVKGRLCRGGQHGTVHSLKHRNVTTMQTVMT
jgi:hypothetical protein